MSGAMQELEEMRSAVGEIDALAALLLDAFDHADWAHASQLLVERTGYVLAILAAAASHTCAMFERFQIAYIDAQAAPAGERWDHEGNGTKPGPSGHVSRP